MSRQVLQRRRLLLEPLEPRWTMDAQACPAILEAPDYGACVLASSEVPASPAEVASVQQALNQFALDMYAAIAPANSTEPSDQAISPFSISAALAMVYAGTRGETASQLAQALHLNLPPERFHAAMQTILQDILPAATDHKTQLEIANSLWGQEDFAILDAFRQLTHDRYGADYQTADFKHAPGAATDAINAWVRAKTHDMIDKLFDQLKPDTRLVLANALYFKAAWAKGFQASATNRTEFHLASGSTRDVAMMHSGGYYRYTETGKYQIAELPYEGNRYSLVVLLPKDSDADLAVDFSAADLSNWLDAMQSTDLSVALPKFKLETSLSLIDTLKSLGIQDAFDERANFTGIHRTEPLYISQAVHKAVVDVNETGTEAAAATGISITSLNSAYHLPSTPIPFYADHPFHFLIRDSETDSILFLGQLQSPPVYVGTETTAVKLPKFTASVSNSFDVNGDGEETPADALFVINFLNSQSSETTIEPATRLSAARLLADVDNDGIVAPADALMVINRLNDRSRAAALLISNNSLNQAEGESAASGTFDSAAVDLLLGLDDLCSTTSSCLSNGRGRQ